MTDRSATAIWRNSLLTLAPRQWFAWQQISPGGLSASWRAQLMLVTDVRPLKTGESKLALSVMMVPRALMPMAVEAVIRFTYKSDDLLVGEWRSVDLPQATVALTQPDVPWLQHNVPWALRTRAGEFLRLGLEGDIRSALESGLGTDPAAIMRGAAADLYDDSLPPQPSRTGKINLSLMFEGVEAFLLLRGLSPMRSPSKWFIYRDENRVVFRRAATGLLVWELAIETTEDGAVNATSLTVNLDRASYSFGTPEEEIAAFKACISDVVLGKSDVVWPSPSSPAVADLAWQRLSTPR